MRRLIVNADDFGRSRSVNEAVHRACGEGILTTASLMVNEPACGDAVALARENPRLGVGLHLALVCGQSALSDREIPGLTSPSRRLSDSPVGAGVRYFFNRRLRVQLEREMGAQFERFRATGLPLDHVNGHLHIHLHPTVFDILVKNARAWEIRHLRLTFDPFRLNVGLAGGHWGYKISHYLVYRVLSARARAGLRRLGIKHTDRVFGLLQNARVDEAYVTGLLRRLPDGDSELYSHPSLDEAKPEFDALVSPRVKGLIEAGGVRLIRYCDI